MDGHVLFVRTTHPALVGINKSASDSAEMRTRTNRTMRPTSERTYAPQPNNEKTNTLHNNRHQNVCEAATNVHTSAHITKNPFRLTRQSQSIGFLHVFQAVHDFALHDEIDADLVLDALLDGEHLLFQFRHVAAEVELHVVAIRHAERQLLDNHFARIIRLCGCTGIGGIRYSWLCDWSSSTGHSPTTIVSVWAAPSKASLYLRRLSSS